MVILKRDRKVVNLVEKEEDLLLLLSLNAFFHILVKYYCHP